MAHLPLPRYEPVRTDFPDESIMCVDVEEAKDDDLLTMYIEELSKQKRSRVVLLSSEGVVIHKAYKIRFLATNNMMEYKALLVGLREAQTLGVKKLRALGDSKVVVSQIIGKWKVGASKVAHYHEKAKELMSEFNRLIDWLAILASIIEMPNEKDFEAFMIRKLDSPSVKSIDLTKGNPAGILPKVPKDRGRKVKPRSPGKRRILNLKRGS